jgi:hypothetical protein
LKLKGWFSKSKRALSGLQLKLHILPRLNELPNKKLLPCLRGDLTGDFVCKMLSTAFSAAGYELCGIASY